MAIFPDFEDVGLVLCEVQGRGKGKAEVFRLLEERHGVPASRVVAVGDQQNDVPMLREVRARYINRDKPPASTLVGVAALVGADWLIEIEVVAVLAE